MGSAAYVHMGSLNAKSGNSSELTIAEKLTSLTAWGLRVTRYPRRWRFVQSDGRGSSPEGRSHPRDRWPEHYDRTWCLVLDSIRSIQ